MNWRHQDQVLTISTDMSTIYFDTYTGTISFLQPEPHPDNQREQLQLPATLRKEVRAMSGGGDGG